MFAENSDHPEILGALVHRIEKTDLATEGDDEIAEKVDHVISIPHTLELLTPILSVVPLQLLAYHMAVMRGCNVDQPRNLAKSVTVE